MIALQIKNKLLQIGAIALVCGTLYSCEKEAIQTLPQRDWELVWSDEFEGAAGTSPDNTKWVFDIGRGPNNDGWGNNELQTYTRSTENVKLDGKGNLMITATGGGGSFNSGRIKTLGKFSQTYGRFEARIQTPTGPGLWPAFWMLGDNITTVDWPQCGEIDIMEQKGHESHVTYGSIHGPGYSGGGALGGIFVFNNGRFNLNFHVYAVEWSEDVLDFYVDGFLYERITIDQVEAFGEWVYNQPFFILLNVAVGGSFVGFPTTGTAFPQSMIVDYVRVYQEKN
jgi:beta-glucanase (GH16 family)